MMDCSTFLRFTCTELETFECLTKIWWVAEIISMVIAWANPKPAVNTCFLVGSAVIALCSLFCSIWKDLVIVLNLKVIYITIYLYGIKMTVYMKFYLPSQCSWWSHLKVNNLGSVFIFFYYMPHKNCVHHRYQNIVYS